MKCYTHRSSDAIAVCRSCGRALCPDCVAEVGLSCACKNRCEPDVARYNAMITRDYGAEARKRLEAAVPRGYDKLAYMLIMGVGFVGFGVYNFGGHGVNWFFVGMG